MVVSKNICRTGSRRSTKEQMKWWYFRLGFFVFTSWLGLPGHLQFFQEHFVFLRDTVGYFHGRPQEGPNRNVPPPGNWTKKQKCLENLQSASRFWITDSILAITFYLPVWHSHCTRACFAVLVWCSDELAVHSCPVLRLQTQTLRNLQAHCSTVVLCWVTLTWQWIFKRSLQVTIVNALFLMWLLISDIFDSWCSDTVTLWRRQLKILGLQNICF